MVEEPKPSYTMSESLLRLQRIILRFRWGVFVTGLVGALYLRQVGISGMAVDARAFTIVGLLGLASALDEYLLRNVQRWGRLALYCVALGDWLLATSALVLAPHGAIQYPFAYFLPIVVASISLGPTGGVALGLVSSLALVLITWHEPGAKAYGGLLPWGATFLIAGWLVGYVGQQWEATQRNVEATYHWVAELSDATTLAEVAEVILRYLENVVHLREGAGTTSRAGSAVVLLTPGEHEGQFAAYAAKGISPEVRARLRVSTRKGLLQWLTVENRPIWVELDKERGSLALPEVEELARFRSCLVVPIGARGKVLALGLAFTTKLASQGEIEIWGVSRFSQQAAASLRKAMVYAQMERQVGAFASVLEKTRYGGPSDVNELFRWAMAKARELVGAEMAALAILNKRGELVVASTYGSGAEELVARELSSRSSPSGWVVAHKSPVIISDYPNDTRFSPREHDAEAFRSALLVPLKTQDEAFGVLAAGSSERMRFNQNDLVMFVMLGQQVSLVLQEHRLQLEIQRARHVLGRQVGTDELSQDLLRLDDLVQRHRQELKEVSDSEGLYRKQMLVFAQRLNKMYELIQGQAKEISEARHELEQAQQGIVSALAMALERNYQFLFGSGDRVARLAMAIGNRLGRSTDEQKDLYYAGLLRDVGLIGLPREILLAPNLDEEQMALVRKHPEIGYAMLGPFPFLSASAVIVRHHHERWDGTGYPDRLAGAAIPLGSRIVAVADVYEALTSERSYRGALSPREALETILNNAGSQFDAEICSAFAKVFEERHDVAGWVLPEMSEQ